MPAKGAGQVQHRALSGLRWLARSRLPGWSRRQLNESLDLVRTLMVPDWDIHPEMITHTRVIDLKTGRPFEAINSGTMENSYPQEDKSVDELATYLAYALRVLKNCGLPCEGVTTPGGFGNRVKPQLSRAAFEAVRDIYGTDLPHYFKYVVGQGESSQPVLEHVRGLDTDDPQVIVNVLAGTGDWFGGWEGSATPEPDRYATEDGESGRMIEMIAAGEPAVFLCHWPGLYCNGEQRGYRAFQRIVRTINGLYKDRSVWMKPSEIARYWAAKELTTIRRDGGRFQLSAPFGAARFTLRLEVQEAGAPAVDGPDGAIALSEVREFRLLRAGTWLRDGDGCVVCLDLAKGETNITVAGAVAPQGASAGPQE
ncbi:MAG: hypothetical protein R3B90_05910 [Planctomycetaceae bacterium]